MRACRTTPSPTVECAEQHPDQSDSQTRGTMVKSISTPAFGPSIPHFHPRVCAAEHGGLTGFALTPLQAEILRRNAECNADAPAELFASRDGFVLPPFRWDDGRRALIRAELDARIARLYGLSRDELRYILDPADVYGPDFPGETFRVLKEKEIKQFGEYRTRRLVLAAWDAEDDKMTR
jgi:hypothetical protein